MKNNQEILNYLTKNLNENEIKLFEDKLISDISFKNEFEKISKSYNNTVLDKRLVTPENYKNEVIINIHKKIESKNKNKMFYRFSYSFSFAAIILILGILYYPGKIVKINKPLVTFTQSEKEIINSIKADQETINTIYRYDILPVIISSKKTENVYAEYDEDIKEIAQYDKNYLVRNDIPAVDDITLYDYLDSETIEKVFSKIEKL
ncbi:MAG: hypothetical protein V1773_08975 [bacterium]